MQKERGKLDFILLGFSQLNNTRRFTFERTGAGVARETFTVDADTVIARRYKIATQDLPLLCRRLLDGADATVSRTLVFSEAQMCSHAAALASEHEQRELRRKAFRRHTPAEPEPTRT